ncbi:hypothetical protein PMAYCL1PPCAC_31717, partial [Pristionchus mayeri]
YLQGYSFATTVISCISNFILIYVLAVTHLPHVGPYRYLLLTFAIVDVLISLVHFGLVPAIHMTEFGYIYFGYRFLHAETGIGVWASLVWVLLFYQTFVLLAFHYVYRFVMMCSPTWLSWMKVRPWRNWLIVTIIADFIFVGGILLACFLGLIPIEVSRKAFAPVLMDVYHIDLFAQNKPGYLGIAYWVRNRSSKNNITTLWTMVINKDGLKEWIPRTVLVILWVILLFFTTAAIIVWCMLQIIWSFKKSWEKPEVFDEITHYVKVPFSTTISPASKKQQRQLFTTLLWQV